MNDELRHQDLLDADAISRLSQLEIVATRFIEGCFSGRHRSPMKGGGVEFSEHRSYSPGDEIRLIDWRAFGRSERHYVKLFELETDLQALLVLDASGSMAFGRATRTKFDYARVAAACLARLLLYQRDSVGLAVVDTDVRTFIPPRCMPVHFRSILEGLGSARPAGETSLAEVLHRLAERVRRRGMVILLSDCLDEVEPLLRALSHLRSRGHETLLLHVLAPEELSFSFRRETRFECLEEPSWRIDLDPGEIRRHYLARLRAFLDRLRGGCGEMGCDYAMLVTDEPVGEALARHLARRMARAR